MTFIKNNNKKDIDYNINSIGIDDDNDGNNNISMSIFNSSQCQNENKKKSNTFKNNFVSNHPANQTQYLDEDHTFPALLLFLFGFFTVVSWIVCVIYLKSRNKVAKGFAIASLVLFIIAILILVILTCIFLSFYLLLESYDSNN